jgi:uncharacterized protein YjiK
MKSSNEPTKDAREEEVESFQRVSKNSKKALILIPLLLIVVLALAFSSGIKKVFKPGKKKNKGSLEYNIKEESTGTQANTIVVLKRWDLPEKLLEISGLAWLDTERFACVQDETGSVFLYNAKNGSIEKEIPFAGPGDYEGLALVGETAWVLRSDGHLFEINSIRTDKPVVKEYDTPLTADHNTEGLCYDPKNNRLLVAIKEDEPGGEDFKGIYSFDLDTRTMAAQPVMKIDLKDELFSGQASSKKKAKSGDVMMPSGIAVHPGTGDIYITEGRKPKLLVTDGSFNTKRLYLLDQNEFLQPEGITFSPSGELFVSNEGLKQPGNILQVELGDK